MHISPASIVMLVGAVFFSASFVEAQEKKTEAPKTGSNAEAHFRKKLDELKPAVDQINDARKQRQDEAHAANSEVESARAKVSAARSALVSAQTAQAATTQSLRMGIKTHPDVKAAEDKLRQAREAEDKARAKAVAEVTNSPAFKDVQKHAEETRAAIEEARQKAKPNEAFIEAASAQISEFNQQMGAMQTKALLSSPEYIEAARNTRTAMEEVSEAKRKLERDLDKDPKHKEAWDAVVAAQKEVMAAEKELGAAERKRNEAEAAYNALGSRAFILNREYKELETRVENAKKYANKKKK